MEYIALADFVNTLFPDLPENETVCLAKPHEKGFHHYPATPRKLKQIEKKPDEYYICVCSVEWTDPLRRRKRDCRAAYVLMLDDIGTKCEPPPLAPSCILETSEDNYQYLYFLNPWELKSDEDVRYFEACMRGIVKAGYADPGTHDVTRVFRLPGSINRKQGRHDWQTRITMWQPDRVWDLGAIMPELGIEPVFQERKYEAAKFDGEIPDDLVDPVLEWFGEQGLLGELRENFIDIRCPWAEQHTTGDGSAGYSALGMGDSPLLRGFNCFHAHCEHRTAHDLLAWVARQGGPGVSVSGVAEVTAAQLNQYTRDLTTGERVTLLYASLPRLFKKNMPDLTYTADGKLSSAQKPTRPNVQYVFDQLDVCARVNMQTHKPEYFFQNKAIEKLIKHEDESLRCILDVCTRMGMGGSAVGEIPKISNEIALNDRYHPMAEWITSQRWDGKDRFTEMSRCVRVEEEYRAIWPRYLKRWMIQCVQAVCGWRDPQQMRGCLVIAGRQELGKSRFFGSLVPSGFFKEGAHIELHGGAAKDSIMENTAFPIVELGELETTFSKSATGQLKAFLAMRKDVYRAPYDTKAREWPRATVFCGTVNGRAFLIDETGSTRFWPVWATWINPDHGIDIQQLWAQVHTWWLAGEKWWLNTEESDTRRQLEEGFNITRRVDEEVVEWLENHKWPGTPMNATKFCKMLEILPNNPNLASVRELLTRHLGKPKPRLKGVKNAWDIPTTPGHNTKITGLLRPED